MIFEYLSKESGMKTLWIRCSTVVLFLTCASISYGSKDDILVIESYHKDFIWDSRWIKGLESKLQGKGKLTYVEMNTKRIPPDQFEASAAQAIKRYEEIKPGLVILGDDDALRLVGPRMIQDKMPVVYLGINNNPRNYFKTEPENMTGVLERPLFKRSVSFISEIHPGAKKILLMFDDSFTSKTVKDDDFSFRGQETMEIGGVTLVLKNIQYYDEWQNIVKSSKGEYTALVMGLTNTIKDRATNKVIETPELIKWTMQNTPIPPYSFWDTTIGNGGTIGGFVLYGRTMGETAGDVALQVLNGTPPSKIRPIVLQEGRLLFDEAELKRWKINLPESVRVRAEFFGQASAH